MNDEELHKAQESQRTYSRRPEVESKVRYLLSLRPAQREGSPDAVWHCSSRAQIPTGYP